MSTVGKIILTIIVAIIALVLTAILPSWSKIISGCGALFCAREIWKD